MFPPHRQHGELVAAAVPKAGLAGAQLLYWALQARCAARLAAIAAMAFGRD